MFLKLFEEENYTSVFIKTELGKTGFKYISKPPGPRVGQKPPVLEDLSACHKMWEEVWH